MTRRLSDKVRLYWGGYDFGSATTQTNMMLSTNAQDPTVLTDSAERALSGIRNDGLTWSGIFESGTLMPDIALASLLGTNAGTNTMATYHVGTTTGDVAYAAQVGAAQHGVPVNVTDLVRHEVTFQNDGTWKRGAGWVRTTLTGTGATNNTGSVNNGAVSTGSGTLIVQFLETSGGTGTLRLQDSADGNTFAFIGATAIAATAGASVRVNIGSGGDGTIRQYTRIAEIMGTGTQAIFSAVLVRGT